MTSESEDLTRFLAEKNAMPLAECEEPLVGESVLLAGLSMRLLAGITRIAFRDFDGQEAVLFTLRSGNWTFEQSLCDLNGLRYSGIIAQRHLGRDPRPLLIAAYKCGYPYVDIEAHEVALGTDLVEGLAGLTGMTPGNIICVPPSIC